MKRGAPRASGAPAARSDRIDRRLAAATLLGGAAVVAAALLVLVPWDQRAGAAAPVSEVFSAAEVARAETFARGVRPLGWTLAVLPLLLAAAACLPPAHRVWRRLADRLPAALVPPVVVAGLVLVTQLAATPVALALRQRRLAAGLTDQSLAGWLGDRALAALVSWAVLTALALVVLLAARRWPGRWFLAAGVGSAGLVLGVAALSPLVLEPLFNDFRPLTAAQPRQAVLDLAAVQGVEVEEVLVADASKRTTTLNAYVSGIGPVQRVVVYDTALASLPLPQLRSVVAHELAHAAHRDVEVGTGLAALALVPGTALLALVLDNRRLSRLTGVRGAGDPAGAVLVVALLLAGVLATTPAVNAVSRAVEARADREALAATGDPAAFVRLQHSMAVRSLADPAPPSWSHWFFGTHPTVLQRVELARAARGAGR